MQAKELLQHLDLQAMGLEEIGTVPAQEVLQHLGPQALEEMCHSCPWEEEVDRHLEVLPEATDPSWLWVEEAIHRQVDPLRISWSGEPTETQRPGIPKIGA